MCVTCTTAVDVAATNAVLVGAYALNRWERIRDRLVGRSRLERDQATWESNAAFLAGLGLDPLATLGAPPTVPAGASLPDAARADAAAPVRP